jgi:hypothetical protein
MIKRLLRVKNASLELIRNLEKLAQCHRANANPHSEFPGLNGLDRPLSKRLYRFLRIAPAQVVAGSYTIAETTEAVAASFCGCQSGPRGPSVPLRH